MTNERNDLRTRRVASWSQTQEGGRSDEKAHRKKEDEKSQVETWSQTQTVEVADGNTQREEDTASLAGNRDCHWKPHGGLEI